MPFLVNGKEISLKDAKGKKDNDEVVDFILNKLNEISKKLPANFIFDKKYRKRNPVDHTQIDQKAMIGIGTKALYYGEDSITTEVTYYDRTEFDVKGNKIYVLEDGDKHIKFTGNMTITAEKAELAVYIFGLLEKKFVLTTFSKEVPLVYVDSKAIAKSEMDIIREKAAINNLVLEMEEDQLPDIAKSIGVANVDELTSDQRRKAIYDLVIGDKNIEKQVREAMNPNPDTELKVQIQNALDKKVIVCESAGKSFRYVAMVDGKEDRVLLSKGSRTTPLMALFEFFAKSVSEQEYLQQLLDQ